MMKKLRVITSTISIMIAFILFQIHNISNHDGNKYEWNVANANLFVSYFDLLSVCRTFQHEKGIFYWFNWIENDSGLSTMNKTLSLLHFDVHGLEDNSNEAFHVCTAPNLFIYDFFVKQSLDIAYNTYFNDFNAKENVNVTRHSLRKGYIKDIVWIYPNHWTNYSQEMVMNTSYKMFRKMIHHQIYFLNPKQGQILYLNNPMIEQNEIWNKLFDTNKIFKSVQNKVNSFDNLEINIWSLSLNEYLNEAYFTNINTNNIILDLDLDFFFCQEPAQTFINHFKWNQERVNQFNNIISNHQYIPSHLFSEYSNQAIITLLYLINENKTQINHKPLQNTSFKMPQIEDVFTIGIQHKMDIETLKRVMFLLYEYQLERSQNQNLSPQHLLHFDNIFQILNIAHRRMIDIDIIGYKDSEEALHTIKVPHSNHMKQLFEIAKRKAKEEHFLKQKQETIKIRNINRNKDDTLKEFEEFATKLIEIDKHRNLLSAEIDEFGQQKEIHTIYQTEWKDHELKDLMNMTTDYLYNDWHKLLFNDNKDNEYWKYKYPEWINKQINDDKYVEHHMMMMNNNAPYNQDKDHIKMYTNTKDDKQRDFILHFNDLDPIQQHLIQRGNHSALKTFINELNPKQHLFLKWLIFCYYHQIKCRGRKYLPNTFNKSRHFGYDFAWHEINGWPQLIEDDAKSEALQLKISRYHSQFTSFIDAEPEEIRFSPSTENLEKTLSELEQILSAKNSKLVIVGIELSPAHIPKQHRHKIECKIYKLIENAMFNRKEERKPCFVRLKKLDNDRIVGSPLC